MGNLARASYERSTTFVWPWSYNECNDDVPHLDTKQEINACDDSPGYGMNPKQGRGAPEIDLFEVMPGHNMPDSVAEIPPFMSCSYQLSPGIPRRYRPINGQQINSSQQWYEVEHHPAGYFNFWFWGQECGPHIDLTDERIYKYLEDAISVNFDLTESHFNQHHTYRLEWQPGRTGYLYWYLDGEMIMGLRGEALYNKTKALIPVEPMYLIMNIAISHRWGMPEPCPVTECPVCWQCYDCANPECQCTLPNGMKNCRNLPAQMKIDYVRIYQDLDDPLHSLGCSTEQFPTAEFIAGHPERYADWQPYQELKITQTRFAVMMMVSAAIALLILAVVRFTNTRCKKQRRGYSSYGYIEL